MAKRLDKTGIATGETILAGEVSQSVDAFRGLEAYDINVSGSFSVSGSIIGEVGLINLLHMQISLTMPDLLHTLNLLHMP